MKNCEIELSIAFITYNRAEELIRAIKSCFPIGIESYEVVIWDNNSDKENQNAIKDFIKSSDLPIKYSYSESNLGVAGGRNAIMKECSGKYLFFLDDDAVIRTPFLIKKLYEKMLQSTDLAALAVNIEEPVNNTNHICEYRKKMEDGSLAILYYLGGTHLIRRDACNGKLYPDKLFFGSEELYASLTFWSSGYQVCEISDLTVDHLPSKINRVDGKVRDLNLLVNQYVIKKLTYPLLLRILVYFIFRLRIKKNGFKKKDYKKILVQRYDKSDIHRITYKSWLKLVSYFGLKPLI